MCKYCKESKDMSQSVHLIIKGDILNVRHNYNKGESTVTEDITIKYCPMCGEKLIKHNKNKQK